MRKFLLLGLVIFTGIIFVGRLFYLQVFQDESNSLENDNAIRKSINTQNEVIFMTVMENYLSPINQPTMLLLFQEKLRRLIH